MPCEIEVAERSFITLWHTEQNSPKCECGTVLYVMSDSTCEQSRWRLECWNPDCSHIGIAAGFIPIAVEDSMRLLACLS